MANEKQSLAKQFENNLEYFIFASRWIQAPLYLGLIVAQIVYYFKAAAQLGAPHRSVAFTVPSHAQVAARRAAVLLPRALPTAC